MSNVRKYVKDRKEEQKVSEDQSYVKKIKKHRATIKILIAAAVLIIILGILIYNIYMSRKVYADYSVSSKVELSDITNSNFYKFGNYVIKYSSDGLICMDGTNQVWNMAFEMKEPIIDICGDYGAIAETNSNIIYIFGTKGQVGQVTTFHPISKLQVAGQGVVAAATEDNTACYLELADKDGNVLASGQTVLSGEGYPLDLALSEDGTKLVVSYFIISENEAQTKVVFYNYSEVGKSEVDRVQGGFNYNGTVIPKVEFVDNDTVVAFGDDIISIYSMKQKPSKIADIDIDEEIKSILYSDKYIGAVVKREVGDKPYEIKVYDLLGNNKLNYDFNMNYTNIDFDKDSILMYNDTTCKVVSLAGVLKFDYTFEGGIVDIIPSSDDYHYMLIDSSSIKEISLK